MNSTPPDAGTTDDAAPTVITVGAQVLLRDLLDNRIVYPDTWERLPEAGREELKRETDAGSLLARLVDQKLLTPHQANRIGKGRWRELAIGAYRVLDVLGTGASSVVLKAEHLHLRRPAAIKILCPVSARNPEMCNRFRAEMRSLARLRHPNIVAALDAGEAPGWDPDCPNVPYLVMEHVEGRDLEELVRDRGPLPFEEACGLVYQVAAALEEIHKFGLVHRDVKPPNIRVTPDGRAKLLDLGLARDFNRRVTESGAIFGTVHYMAPEQTRDSHAVDIRTDLYGLGGTLFWALTGQVPFPARGSVIEELTRRQSAPPPSARVVRPELPVRLDAVIARMMATDPDDRYPAPATVMRALLPFLKPEAPVADAAAPASEEPAPLAHRVLIVDDEVHNRGVCRMMLERAGVSCDEAGDGATALEALRAKPYDLVLLDIDMPRMKGTEVLHQLRKEPPRPHLKVIMLSGRIVGSEMAGLLAAGADDYLAKPFSVVELTARVKAALALKDTQDRSDLLGRHLLATNHGLEQSLHARDSDLIHARNALSLALAEVVTYRDPAATGHLHRLQRFVRRLAEEVAPLPCAGGLIDEAYVRLLEGAAPLHDIGKVALPDHILQKPGPYTTEERAAMRTHTSVGASILAKVARRHGFAAAFLQTATDIARHHHEWYDGTGYPDRRSGDEIPLAARLVALADAYDALRSRRPYRPALPHEAALEVMAERVGSQFDPSLWQPFRACAPDLDRIFRELSE